MSAIPKSSCRRAVLAAPRWRADARRVSRPPARWSSCRLPAKSRHANDEAVLTLMVEEQDKDKAAAASRVNQKMKQGIDIVRARRSVGRT